MTFSNVTPTHYSFESQKFTEKQHKSCVFTCEIDLDCIPIC